MQISVLRKLLHLIKSEIPKEERSLEEISEQSPQTSEGNSELEIQNSEPEIESDDKDDNDIVLEEQNEEEKVVHVENNRSHLTSSVPRAAKVPLGTLTKGELSEIRTLFKNLDDNEIQRLYKKVTK